MDWKRLFVIISIVLAFVLVQSAAGDVYPVILHGKVTMEDGSPPPVVVAIERVCSDVYGSAPGPITNKKGEFIWRMDIDPLESRNCVIRATHAGYSSTEVEVSGVDTTHTTLELPTIIIQAKGADPYTIDFSDNNISGKAKGEWKAAVKALDAQNVGETEKHLKAVVADAPKAWQAWHGLGVVQEKLNELADARTDYEHAIAADAKIPQPYVTLTRLCIKTKDWNCAAMNAQELIKLDTKHMYPEIYLHLAVAQYELKDLNAAQQSAEEAVQKNGKKLPRAEYVLGRILEAKGDIAGAKEHMTKYLRLDAAPADVELIRGHMDNLGKPPNGVDPDLEYL